VPTGYRADMIDRDERVRRLREEAFVTRVDDDADRQVVDNWGLKVIKTSGFRLLAFGPHLCRPLADRMFALIGCTLQEL
jgi:hypothetical protein